MREKGIVISTTLQIQIQFLVTTTEHLCESSTMHMYSKAWIMIKTLVVIYSNKRLLRTHLMPMFTSMYQYASSM